MADAPAAPMKADGAAEEELGQVFAALPSDDDDDVVRFVFEIAYIYICLFDLLLVVVLVLLLFCCFC